MIYLFYFVAFVTLVFIRRWRLNGASLLQNFNQELLNADGSVKDYYLSFIGKDEDTPTSLTIAFKDLRDIVFIIRREKWYHRFTRDINIKLDQSPQKIAHSVITYKYCVLECEKPLKYRLIGRSRLGRSKLLTPQECLKLNRTTTENHYASYIMPATDMSVRFHFILKLSLGIKPPQTLKILPLKLMKLNLTA